MNGFNINPFSWLKGSDPTDPQTGGAKWLGDAPFPMPGDTAYPRLKPPTENIKNDVGNIFNSSTSVGEKLTSAADLIPQAFGLPQEAATRVLTGNQYSLPSQVPGVKEKFGADVVGSDVAGMFSNMLLDPINLLAVPALAKAMKGEFLATKLYDDVKNFNEIRVAGKDGLLFNSLDDMQRLFQKANVQPPIKVGPSFYGIDWENVNDPDKLKSALQAAKKDFYVRSLAEKDPATGKWTMPPQNTISGSTLTPNEPNPIQEWFGTPANISEPIKASVGLMNDAHQARGLMIKDLDKQMYNILEGPMYDQPSGPLARAMVYTLRGLDDVMAKDKSAQAAIDLFGQDEFDKRVLGMRNLMAKAVQVIPNEVVYPDRLFGEGVKQGPPALGKYYADIFKNGLDIPMTQEIANQFGGQAQINPNTANLMDFAKFFNLYVSKRATMDPAEEAIRNMIGSRSVVDGTTTILKNGTVSGLKQGEYDYINSMLQLFKGQPQKLDGQLADFLTNNTTKDWMRNFAWGSDLAKQAAAGEDLTDTPGLRGTLGLTVERLIGAAEKRQYLAQNISSMGRDALYTGMLGLNIGSAIKNLTQLINPITEYGITNVLQGMGGMMNPEWRNYLNTSGIIDRTSSSLSEMYKNIKMGEKNSFMDFLMSPFQAAESFTRGATFTTALNNLKGTMPLGDAIDKATEITRNLMFGYSMTDVSPYIKNPVIRPFFQFATYPLKQTELLLDMVKGLPQDVFTNLDPMANRFVRYLTLMGGAVGYGQHIGVDVKDAFMGGLIPNSIGGAPLYEAAGQGLDVAKQWATDTFTNDSSATQNSPSKWWQGLGQFLKMTVPAGSYGAKLAKNALEADDFWNKALGTNFDIRQTLANHPWMQNVADALGVRPDAGVDVIDRMYSLMGFKSVRAENRQDMMTFMKNFSARYREAISNINYTATVGGDIQEEQSKWSKYLNDHFGNEFQRLGVPTAAIFDTLRPTISGTQMAENRMNLMKSNVQAAATHLPTKVKPFMLPPLQGGSF